MLSGGMIFSDQTKTQFEKFSSGPKSRCRYGSEALYANGDRSGRTGA
jgi:hypothetical protein